MVAVVEEEEDMATSLVAVTKHQAEAEVVLVVDPGAKVEGNLVVMEEAKVFRYIYI